MVKLRRSALQNLQMLRLLNEPDFLIEPDVIDRTNFCRLSGEDSASSNILSPTYFFKSIASFESSYRISDCLGASIFS